jgi:hypothetical protein
MESKGSPEAVKALRTADDFYRKTYAPMFASGTPGKITLEARRYGPGEKLVKDEDILTNFLGGSTKASPTNMREFHQLYGGILEGTQPQPEAYRLLMRHIEGKFRENIHKGRLDPEDFDAFMRDYAAAFEGAPDSVSHIVQGTADKLSRNAAQIARLNDRIEVRERRMKSIMGGPISGEVGMANSKEALSKLLADPNKMSFTVRNLKKAAEREGKEPGHYLDAMIREIYAQGYPMKDGGFDPAALSKLLTSGHDGLTVLFREKYGVEGGDRHLSNLRQIAKLSEQVARVSHEGVNLKLGEFTDPMQEHFGTSTSSVTSIARSQEMGKTSGVFNAAFMGVRYLLSRSQRAYNKAVEDSILNPKQANAIVKMLADANDGKMPSRDVAAAALNDPQTIEALFGHVGDVLGDNIRLQLVRGGIFGVRTSEEERKKNERPAG